MREIQVGTAQFEARDGDKAYNLGVIETLSRRAAGLGAGLVCFHECSISGYTWLETLARQEFFETGELVPGGPSTGRLIAIARDAGIAIGAGLIESAGDRRYNCFVVVSPDGFVARHRKLHDFIHPDISNGDAYTVFDLAGCRFGILTCYDNNLPENARVTAMMGAEILLAPHVTGCLPSPAPGRGTVAREVWKNRHHDPVRCRMEFDGPKGRGWLLKWLPARGWENGVYLVYANVIGIDGGTVKPGGSMIIDPYGEIVAECRTLDDEVVVATLVPENLELASGSSYIRARRPELYGKLVEANPALGANKQPEVYWKKIREKAHAS